MCETGFSESTESTVRIDYHPDAVHELEASANWYAERNLTAARTFPLAIDAAIQKISDDPERFLKIDRWHQACSVKEFPFQVVFRHEGERIYIVAVAHAKRRPGYWRGR